LPAWKNPELDPAVLDEFLRWLRILMVEQALPEE
jgi:hypothetical protein